MENGIAAVEDYQDASGLTLNQGASAKYVALSRGSKSPAKSSSNLLKYGAAAIALVAVVFVLGGK